MGRNAQDTQILILKPNPNLTSVSTSLFPRYRTAALASKNVTVTVLRGIRPRVRAQGRLLVPVGRRAHAKTSRIRKNKSKSDPSEEALTCSPSRSYFPSLSFPLFPSTILQYTTRHPGAHASRSRSPPVASSKGFWATRISRSRGKSPVRTASASAAAPSSAM